MRTRSSGHAEAAAGQEKDRVLKVDVFYDKFELFLTDRGLVNFSDLFTATTFPSLQCLYII